jgi:hypothetical protein
MRNVACRYPKIPHLTIDYSKELGRGAFGIVHLVNNMQDGSNAALKRITLSIAKEEPQKAFTDALSEVSSLQMIQISLNKRVVAYKGFYVETDNFESTGCVHLCILLEYALTRRSPQQHCMTPAFQILPRPVAAAQNRHERARARQGRQALPRPTALQKQNAALSHVIGCRQAGWSFSVFCNESLRVPLNSQPQTPYLNRRPGNALKA